MEPGAPPPGSPTKPRPARADEIVLETDGRGAVSAASTIATRADLSHHQFHGACLRSASASCTWRAGFRSRAPVVSTGNPHSRHLCRRARFSAFTAIPGKPIGAEICTHPRFPQQTTCEFVRMTGHDEIEIRIYERGVGPTSSSGTGTCATGSAAIALRGAAPLLRVIAQEDHKPWNGKGPERKSC